jgi:hypothetical protein
MDIELESVGYYADKITNVFWCETFENVPLQRAAVVAHYVKPMACERDREAKINKVRFGLEEGKIYRYPRQTCVKPRQEENRWFKVVGSEIEFLDEQIVNPHFIYSARGFAVMETNEVNQARDFITGKFG